jgi:hypothetical protein
MECTIVDRKVLVDLLSILVAYARRSCMDTTIYSRSSVVVIVIVIRILTRDHKLVRESSPITLH